MKKIEIQKGTERIEDYQYSGTTDLEEVLIPDSVCKIGKHAFYNCRNLKKITISGNLFQIEDGAFKNCDCLKQVVIYGKDGQTACMKNIVADLSHEITFLIHYSDGDAKVLIPSYNYDYEIDINSRVFHEVVYGSGDAYQRCVSKPVLNYGEYDFLFSVAKREETEDTLFELIENRLCYPYKLGENERKKYVDYLKEHSRKYILKKIQMDDQRGLRLCGEQNLFQEEDMDEYLEQASGNKKLETVAFLIEYRKEHFAVAEPEFVF